jgi:hypothetical protein
MPPRLWLAAGIALAAAGCASTHPGGQGVIVTSDPPGATATAPGDQKIRTPGVLYAYPGAREMEISIEKDGFQSVTVILKRDSDSVGECLGKGLIEDLVPPGTEIDITLLAMQIVQRLLLLAIDCPAHDQGLQPSPVFVSLEPIPPVLRSPRD